MLAVDETVAAVVSSQTRSRWSSRMLCAFTSSPRWSPTDASRTDKSGDERRQRGSEPADGGDSDEAVSSRSLVDDDGPSLLALFIVVSISVVPAVKTRQHHRLTPWLNRLGVGDRCLFSPRKRGNIFSLTLVCVFVCVCL